MAKKGLNKKCLVRVKGKYNQLACRFCQKALTNKEVELTFTCVKRYRKKYFTSRRLWGVVQYRLVQTVILP